MSLTRRAFLQQGAATALLTTLPAPIRWASPRMPVTRARLAAHAELVDPGRVRALALRAVEAARATGATYADVRLTRQISHDFFHSATDLDRPQIADQEFLAVGVRALVDGYWGFAASPYWELEEMPILARSAVEQARANALGSPRRVEFGAMPVVTGHWVMPGIDPFMISIEEKGECFNAWRQAVRDTPLPPHLVAEPQISSMNFLRDERAVATSEGTYVTQVRYSSQGGFNLLVKRSDWRSETRALDRVALGLGLGLAGQGWELFLDAQLPDQVPLLIAKGAEQLQWSSKSLENGRYDVVFDAAAAANLLDQTLGQATQLDRAFGDQANGVGTSYLGPNPLALLGQAVVGSPLLTVTANRSLPGGTATVQWDDEGVVPEEFPLVQDGLLVDYQTTREQAAWLAPWYAKRQQPVRSHGCAMAPSALDYPIQHTPNLVMQPGKAKASFADLVAGTVKGIAILGGEVSVDFQAGSGEGHGLMREITNGKLGAVLDGGTFLFRSNELWKNLVALGGPESQRPISVRGSKGQPEQVTYHSIMAVPITIKQVSVINESGR